MTIYNSRTPLQKSHFIRKKGENPLDMVFRQGKWISIAEYNDRLIINRKDR
jgi:hypothetical protein